MNCTDTVIGCTGTRGERQFNIHSSLAAQGVRGLKCQKTAHVPNCCIRL
jgi:hypothetical protein